MAAVTVGQQRTTTEACRATLKCYCQWPLPRLINMREALPGMALLVVLASLIAVFGVLANPDSSPAILRELTSSMQLRSAP
ncbi:hypothetical protein ACVWZ4_007237 [Bradyrhizobium sp. USDA 4472]